MEWETVHATPTITSLEFFDPLQDAVDLRKAMKGFGTDENTLIHILCRRKHQQRQEIIKSFKVAFKRNLERDVKSEVSGELESVLLGLLMNPPDLYCKYLKEAMAGLGTDEDTIIEILVTLPCALLKEIHDIYPKLYRKSLEAEMKSEMSGTIRELVLALLKGLRDESGDTSVKQAQADAYDLYKAGAGRLGADEDTFNTIFCKRNYQQLELTFKEYQRKTNKTMDKVIEKEFSGDSKKLLLAIYKCVTSKSDYFAECIYKCKKTVKDTTNQKKLTRIFVTRCDIDLGDIKKSFYKLYKKTLKNFVKEETSGDYCNALLALINEN